MKLGLESPDALGPKHPWVTSFSGRGTITQDKTKNKRTDT